MDRGIRFGIKRATLATVVALMSTTAMAQPWAQREPQRRVQQQRPAPQHQQMQQRQAQPEPMAQAAELPPQLKGACFVKESTDHASIISACTAVIDNPKERPATLAAAHAARGDAYREKGEFDKAIDDLDQAMKLDPRNGTAIYNRGLAYR